MKILFSSGTVALAAFLTGCMPAVLMEGDVPGCRQLGAALFNLSGRHTNAGYACLAAAIVAILVGSHIGRGAPAADESKARLAGFRRFVIEFRHVLLLAVGVIFGLLAYGQFGRAGLASTAAGSATYALTLDEDMRVPTCTRILAHWQSTTTDSDAMAQQLAEQVANSKALQLGISTANTQLNKGQLQVEKHAVEAEKGGKEIEAIVAKMAEGAATTPTAEDVAQASIAATKAEAAVDDAEAAISEAEKTQKTLEDLALAAEATGSTAKAEKLRTEAEAVGKQVQGARTDVGAARTDANASSTQAQSFVPARGRRADLLAAIKRARIAAAKAKAGADKAKVAAATAEKATRPALPPPTRPVPEP